MQGSTIRIVNLTNVFAKIGMSAILKHHNITLLTIMDKNNRSRLNAFHRKQQEFTVLCYGVELFNLGSVEFPIFMALTYP
jgi:hypothetical protein